MAVTKEQMAELTTLLKPQDEVETEEVVEEVEDEVIDDQDTDGDVDDDAGGDEAAEDTKYTPTELAEAIGWEAEDLYNSVMIPMDDGQESISLGEFKNTHQNLVRDFKALQEKTTGLESVAQQAQSGFNQGQQMSQEMIQALGYMDSIKRMEETTDWAELEEIDPTDAMMKRDKFRRAKEDVQATISDIKQKQGQMQVQYLQQASQKMVELIPTWKDEELKTKDFGVIRQAMNTVGFSNQEVDSVIDPRTMSLLKELIDLRALKDSASSAVKKVKGAPKVLAGSRGVPKTVQLDRAQKLVNKAKNTGNKKDELNAVKALIASKQ